MVNLQKVLTRLLQAMNHNLIATINYSSTTTWTKVGNVTLPKEGLYYFFAGWTNSAVLGLGLSGTAQTLPTWILNEGTQKGSRSASFYGVGTYSVWIKCASAGGANNVQVRQILCL